MFQNREKTFKKNIPISLIVTILLVLILILPFFSQISTNISIKIGLSETWNNKQTEIQPLTDVIHESEIQEIGSSQILQNHNNIRGYGEHNIRSNRVIQDSEVMYAIISPANFSKIIEPLVTWKTNKGVPAKIYTLESIYANYTSGADNAENIQAFLRNLDSTSSVLTWVLLVGDSDVVPARELYAEAETYGLDRTYVSDYYYAGLDNDWDKDNDGKHGEGTATSSPKFEGDWSPNVYVGRLPVGNKTDINISINNILAYEKGTGSDPWMNKAIFWGGLMNAPNHITYNRNYTNAYKVKEIMVKPLFEDPKIDMNVFTRYDYSQLEGNNYDYNLDILYRSAAKTDFNGGCSILNFAGQAYYTGNAILHYDDPSGTKLIEESGSYTPLYYGLDGEFSTNGYKRPLVTAFTCGAGDFAETGTYEDQCLERLIMGAEGGAIGVVGSTGKTHRGEIEKSDGNWWMDKKFYEIFFNNTYQPGKALYKMKTSYYNNVLSNIDYQKYKAMLFGYNYMGDPELNIWTAEPEALDINISGLWLEPHNMTITVRDQYFNPVADARVCVQNNELYAYGVTNESGIAQIFVNPTQMEDVDVVVTAHNFLPFEKTYSMGIEPADLKITNSDIEFSDADPAAGQQITINATIYNRGKTDFVGTVKIGFYIEGQESASKDLIGDYQLITDLPKDSQKMVSVQWTAIPGNNIVYVQIDPDNEIYESYKWNNMADIAVYVRQPELFLTEGDIEFIPAKDVYEETKIQIKATIHNTGDAAAFNVTVRFIDIDEVRDEFKIKDDKVIGMIPVNDYKSVITTWIAVGSVHEIKVLIDPENQIQEYNKTNNSASKNITIKYPPILKPLANIEIDEDNITYNATRLVYKISDEDTPLLELNITINSSEPNCVVVLNKYLGIDIYPAPDWFGKANISVTVDDGIITVNDSFEITVNPVNDPPRFNTSNFTILAEEETQLEYQVQAYDPEMDGIVYSLDTNIFEIDVSLGVIKFTPDQDMVNSSPIIFNISISDGELSIKQQFKLRIIDVPDNPVILPISIQYGKVEEEFYLNLKVNAYDIDSDEFYFYDNTSLFTIDPATGVIEFKPAQGDEGTHFIEITVTDDTYKSSTTTFKLVINATQINDTNGNGSENGDGNGNGDSHSEDISWFENTNNLMLVIIIVIIIIIIIISVLLILRKRKLKTKPGNEKEQYFSDDYSRDNTKTSSRQYVDRNEDKRSDQTLDYNEEYRRLYSTPTQAPGKRTGKKSKSKSMKQNMSKEKRKSSKKNMENVENESKNEVPEPFSTEEDLLEETNDIDFDDEYEDDSEVDWLE